MTRERDEVRYESDRTSITCTGEWNRNGGREGEMQDESKRLGDRESDEVHYMNKQSGGGSERRDIEKGKEGEEGKKEGEEGGKESKERGKEDTRRGKEGVAAAVGVSSTVPKSSFDKVNVPSLLVGSTFGQLFLSFLERGHGIAVGISRIQDPSLDTNPLEIKRGRRMGRGMEIGREMKEMGMERRMGRGGRAGEDEDESGGVRTPFLPFVITAPAMNTVMRLGDEVFVFKDAS